MNTSLLLLAAMAGAANWMFRALPTLLSRSAPRPGSLLSAFLGATGPAAITTLFVASVLPQVHPAPTDLPALLAGSAATVLAFLPRRSVVAATLAGALAYGLAVWLALPG